MEGLISQKGSYDIDVKQQDELLILEQGRGSDPHIDVVEIDKKGAFQLMMWLKGFLNED